MSPLERTAPRLGPRLARGRLAAASGRSSARERPHRYGQVCSRRHPRSMDPLNAGCRLVAYGDPRTWKPQHQLDGVNRRWLGGRMRGALEQQGIPPAWLAGDPTQSPHHSAGHTGYQRRGSRLGLARRPRWLGPRTGGVAAAAPPGAETTAAEYYRDTRTGPQTLCFVNQVSVVSASYSNDLRGIPFATIAYAPPRFTGFLDDLAQGGWHARVTAADCPTSQASSPSVPLAGSEP
jgi:hypothetical protein